MEQPTDLNNIEFETKYNTKPDDLIQFKMLAETCKVNRFAYVEGPDDYYVRPGTDDFKRHRYASFQPEEGRQEVTTKVKPKGAKNNNIRKELNWRVDKTPKEVIREQILDEGYEYNFTVWKMCHIYDLDDATLVFYTVVDKTPGTKHNERHFIEIEVNEEIIGTLKEEEAWGIIERYEKLLTPIGIHAQKRIRKSLYEMYVRR